MGSKKFVYFMCKRGEMLLLSVVLVLALFCLGQAAWIKVKAILAQWLIADAWEETVNKGRPAKPWRWADTWPVAKMTTPEGEVLYVMEGISGQSLAFGPGYLSDSVRPGGLGNIVIAGHRDTHFSFLENVVTGDVVKIQDIYGDTYSYQIESTEVVDANHVDLYLHQDFAELELVTCYPFHALDSGGSLRYIVRAGMVSSRFHSS